MRDCMQRQGNVGSKTAKAAGYKRVDSANFPCNIKCENV